MRPALALALAAAACTTTTGEQLFGFDAQGLSEVRTDLVRGSVRYVGTADAPRIDVVATSWATASGAQGADDKRAENEVEVDMGSGRVTLYGRSAHSQAGVDFEVAGPRLVDVWLSPGAGDVEVTGVYGAVVVEGDDVELRDVEGDADVFATGSVIAEVYPVPFGRVELVAMDGSCTVWIPRWAPVHLVVRFDPVAGHEIEDLDWDAWVETTGQVEAIREPGTIPVTVDCRAGAVDVREHTQPW